ncbi:hypothetical protein PRIPAC_75758 [Pristionchus pacificus]|uniref:RING-type domain-containing protein n=1 Tax=Pristionchus pacificus TaxID=54126 RepID=A0A2A6BF81_PRIPA|nr:hypothetical protein PRIPAC_75758 [Pristionchus pacificus]|eukprot:PDM64503.1 hypothetical protein PRIPAC_52759 [Pristionchus pacificus]
MTDISLATSLSSPLISTMLCNNTVDSSMNLIELDSYLHGDWTTHDAATHYEEEDPTVQAAFGNFIQSLREVDEESYNRGDRFSRACRCDRDNPDGRVVSRACLHVVCGECAEFAYEACPICRTPTAFAPLLENPLSPRACTSCYWPAPAERALLSACGHAVCRACAYTLSGQAEARGEAVHCTTCGVPSELIPLEEELIKDVDSITRRFACMEH